MSFYQSVDHYDDIDIIVKHKFYSLKKKKKNTNFTAVQAVLLSIDLKRIIKCCSFLISIKTFTVYYIYLKFSAYMLHKVPIRKSKRF